MSLIVARKFEDQLCIVSDTKLTHSNHEVKGLKTKPSDGVVKTIIINSQVCISFAGDIDDAELALKQINSDDSIDRVIETLAYYHKQSAYKTEFILCYALPDATIYKFKAGDCKEVVSAWIGDQKAFNYFQESMMGVVKKEKKKKGKLKENNKLPATNKPIIELEMMNLSFELQIPDQFSKMSSAMDAVIEDSNIETVGGFKVNVIYKDGFYFNRYGKSYRSNYLMIGEGAHVIGHGEADEGAYSINFFGGSDDFQSVGLHIRQAKIGIIYHRRDNGLLWPQYHWLDEVDFCDLADERYQVRPAFTTVDRVGKFRAEGLQAFSVQDWEKAKERFDKGLVSAKDKQRADLLFCKGVTLLNLQQKNEAMRLFQEAVSLDPFIQYKINQVFAGKREA